MNEKSSGWFSIAVMTSVLTVCAAALLASLATAFFRCVAHTEEIGIQRTCIKEGHSPEECSKLRQETKE